MTTPFERQLSDLQSARAGVVTRPLPPGGTLISIPQLQLPPGWNRPAAAVHFIAPIGFPLSPPDCFWSDAELRLASNILPQATQLQVIPGSNQQALWFSWHVQSWNPNLDSLRTFLEVIKDRFRNVA